MAVSNARKAAWQSAFAWGMPACSQGDHGHLHADEGQVGRGADEGAHAACRQPCTRLLVQRDGLQGSINKSASDP